MRPIRRTDREISLAEAKAILVDAEYGVLSTVDSEGQPYGVPLSYVYRNDAIYFHCALSGQKLDNIDFNAKVSFCAVGKTKVLPDKFATEYESVIAFGVASEVAGSERLDALVWLLEKYCAEFVEAGRQYIKQKDTITKVIKITVQQISGKARRA
jgi:nitroimidazol reductase NimA-like FMN-containing flavoprotein (pyridoxamine 5'-phosphate oxidase superfamily)